MRSRRIAVAMVLALLVLATAPLARAGIDYSKNAAGGDYAPAVAAQPDQAGGTADSGFSWGDAAVGAGAAVALMLAVTLLRGGVRRSGRELPASASASGGASVS